MIDDYEPAKLDGLVRDARNYIDKNELKFKACAARLVNPDETYEWNKML